MTRSGGGGRTERSFLDFVIDGVALSSLIDADFISPFGWHGFESIGPFTFDGKQYHELFEQLRRLCLN